MEEALTSKRSASPRSAMSILAEMSPAELGEAQLTPLRYREIIKDRAEHEQAVFEHRITRQARLEGR